MDLYHVGGSPIAPGQVVRTYGLADVRSEELALVRRLLDGDQAARTALLTGDRHLRDRFKSDPEMQLVLIEAVFERVRLHVAPDLPSRLASAFCWPTSALADAFRRRYRPRGVIHRCTLEQGDAVPRDATLVAVGVDLAANIDAQIAAIEQRAMQYWSATPAPDDVELLVQGRAVVVERLSAERETRAD